MRGIRLGLLALVGGLFVAVRTTGGAALHAPARVDGQWVWTRADAALLQPASLPGVLALSVSARPDGSLATRRGLSPGIAGTGREVALVVRLEDSVHARIGAPDALARELDPKLGRLLAEVRTAGVRASEVQLDYDAPVRRLAEWAEVVRVLRRGALHDVPVWITSIPAHLAVPDYGRIFDGAVTGHILQLFDTGLACTPERAARLGAELERARLPFRLGVATYERERAGRTTTMHECWRRATPDLARAPGFSGAWIFPAGRDTRAALADLEALR